MGNPEKVIVRFETLNRAAFWLTQLNGLLTVAGSLTGTPPPAEIRQLLSEFDKIEPYVAPPPPKVNSLKELELVK